MKKPEFGGKVTSVSVVIPSFKAEKTITKAIDSVLAQSGVSVEIIVVEDGVFDDTSSLIDSYGENVRLISYKSNKGACQARNIGLDNVNNELVMFLDADDYLKPGCLKGLVEQIEKTKSDICFGRVVKKWESGKEKMFTPPRNEVNEEVLVRWLCGRSGPSPCGVLWRRTSLISIGKWNEELSKNQDGEVIMRAMIHGLNVCSSITSEAVYSQYEGEDRVSQRADDKAFLSLLAIDSYLKESSSSVIVQEALNYYRADMAYRALSFNSNFFYEKFRMLWTKRPPKIKFIRLHGIKIYLKHLVYYTFDIKGAFYFRRFLKV